MINLDDFGLQGNTGPISNFTVLMSPETVTTNGTSVTAPPLLSLAGSMYNYTGPAPVPLPLPALLFASGLGVLGLFGRKRKQQG